MTVRCVKSVMTLGDGRKRVLFTDGTTTNYARLVAAVKVGRPLLKSEVAHHRNGDCSDDRLENLEVLSHTDHSRWHGANRRPRVTAAEARVDIVTVRLPEDLRPRLKSLALENERSLNAEIVWRLRQSVDGYTRR